MLSDLKMTVERSLIRTSVLTALSLAACGSVGSSDLILGGAYGLINWGIFSYSLEGLTGNRKLANRGGLVLGAASALFPEVMAVPVVIATLMSVARIVNSINNKPVITEIENEQAKIEGIYNAAKSGQLQGEYNRLEKLKRRLK